MAHNLNFIKQIFIGCSVEIKIDFTCFCSEPSIRGMLTACSAISTNLGIFGTILLGSLMPWRTVAVTCLFLPIITIILLVFVS